MGTSHCLIVDDDRGFVQFVERALQAHYEGCEIRRAYDGDEALRAMRDRPPDLELLDLIMPTVDGFGVLAEMRRDPGLAGVPVLVLTAISYEEGVLARRGGQVLIRRPDGLQPAEVLRCLEVVIGILEPHYDDGPLAEEAVPTSALRSLPPTSIRFG